jgi:hypothetical protein
MPSLPFVFGNSLARKQIDEEQKTRKKNSKVQYKTSVNLIKDFYFFLGKINISFCRINVEHKFL